MKLSWNWLSELVDLSSFKTPEALAELLNARGLEVESVQTQAAGFEKVVAAKILEKGQHPDADRLSLCRVSTGTGEPLEIVCGAQNMKAGDIVALAQIGAELPNGLKIKKGKIRGVTSFGMLCSESELGLADESEGIMILSPETLLGQPLAQALRRDDVILELGLTPNRGDCLSHWGVAREIASHLEQTLDPQKTKKLELDQLFTAIEKAEAKGKVIEVGLCADDEGPQFYGALIEGVQVGPSPEWLVKKLEAIGQRSINNVVDATNYVMFELGQPLHAYDADRLAGGSLRIDRSKKGDKLPLLDGDEIELQGWELVIADSEKPVALAGVMGGGNSEVEEQTTRIYLECAEFSPVLVRKASQTYQKRTEASQRFEKGIDPLGLPSAIARLIQTVLKTAGGDLKEIVRKVSPSREPSYLRAHCEIEVNPNFFPGFLGMNLSEERSFSALTYLGCEIKKVAKKDGEMWLVQPPTYRKDLRIKEDLAEEIARFVGYDKIQSRVPQLTTLPTPQIGNPVEEKRALMSKAKTLLLQEGVYETINYSFNSREWLKELGFKGDVSLQNPLSEEQEVMVPSLLPGLLQNYLNNKRKHFGSEALSVRLFELRPTFLLKAGVEKVEATSHEETGVREELKLSLLLSGPRFDKALRNEQGELDFYDLKGALENLFEGLGTKGLRWMPLCDLDESRQKIDPNQKALLSVFHPGQSAVIWIGRSLAGVAGCLHPKVAQRLKVRVPVWLAELDWESLQILSRAATSVPQFEAWPEYPGIERDFALLVKAEVEPDQIVQVGLKAGKPLAKVVKIFDIYRGSQVAEGMTSVAVRVIFSKEERSLEELEADEASAQILAQWKKELGVELR
jgi:phenylalanyl-tRNA synthetase beta chain